MRGRGRVRAAGACEGRLTEVLLPVMVGSGRGVYSGLNLLKSSGISNEGTDEAGSWMLFPQHLYRKLIKLSLSEFETNWLHPHGILMNWS